MSMEVELTGHFWLRWDKRKEDMLRNGITPELIKEFALNPDMIMEDPRHKGREWRVKEVGGRCLRIVVQVQRDRLEIITAFFDRTLKRKGLCG